MKNGSEYDALTRAKRLYHWKPGVRQWVKRQFNKRVRKAAKAVSNHQSDVSSPEEVIVP